MQKYDIILLDADDTLLDFKLAEKTAILETLSYFGLPTNGEVISKYSEINKNCWKMLERREITKPQLKVFRFAELCRTYSFDADPTELARCYEQKLSEQAFVIDGAVDFCRRLSEKCDVYLITNGIKAVQTGRLTGSGLLPYVKKIFISEDVGFEKPDVRYFDFVASEIDNFSKERALVVGDSLSSDIAGGINFGLDTCWYNPFGADGNGMTYIARSYPEIEAIIFG